MFAVLVLQSDAWKAIIEITRVRFSVQIYVYVRT